MHNKRNNPLNNSQQTYTRTQTRNKQRPANYPATTPVRNNLKNTQQINRPLHSCANTNTPTPSNSTGYPFVQPKQCLDDIWIMLG